MWSAGEANEPGGFLIEKAKRVLVYGGEREAVGKIEPFLVTQT